MCKNSPFDDAGILLYRQGYLLYKQDHQKIFDLTPKKQAGSVV
jgi:hypothetical protein